MIIFLVAWKKLVKLNVRLNVRLKHKNSVNKGTLNSRLVAHALAFDHVPDFDKEQVIKSNCCCKLMVFFLIVVWLFC